MHDPMTVAFEIRAPWFTRNKHFPKGRYHPTLVTVWHVDPERGGSDDSCGFSIPHLSKRQRERLTYFAQDEARHPYFLRRESKEWAGTRSEAEALYRGLLLQVAERIGVRLTYEDAARQAALAIHKPEGVSDAAGIFCFLPGYHSNFEQDRPDQRERKFMETICGIARWMLRDRRPWYRHPRFHVWHWKIQIHTVQGFKRWAFSRCCQCGGRFRWGASVVGYQWDSPGPRWFRGESAVAHPGCDRTRVNTPAATQGGMAAA